MCFERTKGLKMLVVAIRIAEEYDFVVKESEYYTDEIVKYLGCSSSDLYTRLLNYIELNF